MPVNSSIQRQKSCRCQSQNAGDLESKTLDKTGHLPGLIGEVYRLRQYYPNNKVRFAEGLYQALVMLEMKV